MELMKPEDFFNRFTIIKKLKDNESVKDEENPEKPIDNGDDEEDCDWYNS